MATPKLGSTGFEIEPLVLGGNVCGALRDKIERIKSKSAGRLDRITTDLAELRTSSASHPSTRAYATIRRASASGIILPLRNVLIRPALKVDAFVPCWKVEPSANVRRNFG
jgi:hypothetical protein